MVCVDQNTVNGQKVSCGKCETCNYNYRKGWENRMSFESAAHDPQNQAFVTLTYAEVPLDAHYQPTLRKSDLQKFFKRCRKAGHQFRYLAVGEYGTKGGRPHYHLMVWGPHFNEIERMVDTHWGLGITLTLPVVEGAHRYIAKYIVKRTEYTPSTYNRDGEPFKLSSRRPGIGFEGLKELGEQYKDYPHYFHLESTGDISLIYRKDGRWRSLPPRDARIVRKAAGVPELAADRPPKVLPQISEEKIEQARRYIARIEAKKLATATF